jgi:glycosyltransferase
VLKFSIITVSYNAASTIRDTLKSIAEQSYDSIEHIIIDGASSDDTSSIIANFPHVAYYVSEKDKGIYHAMNKGIEMATGDIVGILNADDLYSHRDVIHNVAELFKDSSVDAVYADLNFVDSIDTSKVLRKWRSGMYKISDFYWGWMPPHPTFFIRRNLYIKYGMFNTVLHSSADYELMLRLLLKHEIKTAYLQDVIVNMRQGGKSTASIKNRLIANQEDRMAWVINGLKPHYFTLILKPLRKIKQFINL